MAVEPLAALIISSVFAAVIVLQVMGRGPGLWAVFAAGAIALVASGTLGPGAAADALGRSVPVVVFLFALFVLTAALERAGTIDHLARWLLGRAHRPRDLPLVLFLGIGVVSSVVVNDALVLIGVPLLISVASRLRADPKPLLLVLAFSVTVGSTLTPWGNPQNLYIAVDSGLVAPLTTFLRYLAIPTAINLVVGAYFLRAVYRHRLPESGDPSIASGNARQRFLPRGGWRARLAAHPVLVVFPATIAMLVASDLATALLRVPEVPAWGVALVGAGIVLVGSPERLRTVRRVSWPILLLFAALFVVVAGATQSGVIAGADRLLPIPSPGSGPHGLLEIVGAAVVGSQLVSNVPWVALQLPVLAGLGYGPGTPIAWMALAAGSTLAGNLTLLGAASNLIVVGAAKERGVRISLTDFVREGLPLTAMTIGVLLACLVLGV